MRGMKADAFSRTIGIDVPFSGGKIRIIGLEDFIAMERFFAASPKDIEDAKNALEVSADRINPVLLKELVSSYGKGAQNIQEIVEGKSKIVVSHKG